MLEYGAEAARSRFPAVARVLHLEPLNGFATMHNATPYATSSHEPGKASRQAPE